MSRKRTSRPIPFTTTSARQREAQSFVEAVRKAHHAMDALDDFWIIDDTWYASSNGARRMTARHVFLDAEFVPADGGSMLISIGIVSDDMREFYAERTSADLADALWELIGEPVRAQVRSQLGVRGVAAGTVPEIAGQLAAWLHALASDCVQVVYDYSADFGFVEAIQQQVASPVWSKLVPIHVGYLLEDADGAKAADAEWARIGVERGLHRHHALADAWALRARFHAVHGG